MPKIDLGDDSSAELYADGSMFVDVGDDHFVLLYQDEVLALKAFLNEHIVHEDDFDDRR